MPNWVYCNATISGSAEDMAHFFAAAKKGGNRFFAHTDNVTNWGAFTDIQLELLVAEASSFLQKESRVFSFHSLYPMPVAVQIMPYDPGVFSKTLESNPAIAAFCEKNNVTECGYSWEYNNWGVKWGDCGTEVNHISDTHLCVYFETAWGVPHSFWEKVSLDYPTLTFEMTYEEEGRDFAGEVTYLAGVKHVVEFDTMDDDEDYSVDSE